MRWPTPTPNEFKEGNRARWRGRASNPVGDGIRSRAGSTPAAFRQFFLWTSPIQCGSEPARECRFPVDISLTDPPPSRAGSLPQIRRWNRTRVSDRNPLWERACSRRRRQPHHLTQGLSQIPATTAIPDYPVRDSPSSPSMINCAMELPAFAARRMWVVAIRGSQTDIRDVLRDYAALPSDHAAL